MYSIARLHRYILYILRLNSSASHKEKCFISNVCMLLADCARVLSDHPPRACGENSIPKSTEPGPFGSPPHMRGKLTGEIKAAKMMRITPRTCGENFDGHDVAKIIVGSPPHMRGKLFRHLVTLCHHRITPAHAGKTLYCFEISPCKTDHPRTCGENVNHSFSLFRRGGSPPHMRGKRRFCGAPASIQRITPAHAGKTKALIAFSTTPTDHPRTCGENLVSTHSSVRIFGSPPHMRGKPSFMQKNNPF